MGILRKSLTGSRKEKPPSFSTHLAGEDCPTSPAVLTAALRHACGWPRAVGLASAASAHPTIAPKRRSDHSVSQKWLCATEAGISGLGMSSAKLHTPNNAAMMPAGSILLVFNILTKGYANSAHRSPLPN